MDPFKSTRRHFTEAARIAALEAKRRRREEGLPFGTPQVYVVRQEEDHLRFAWEIRRFGGVVLDRGTVAYATPGAARHAGERALADMAILA